MPAVARSGTTTSDDADAAGRGGSGDGGNGGSANIGGDTATETSGLGDLVKSLALALLGLLLFSVGLWGWMAMGHRAEEEPT